MTLSTQIERAFLILLLLGNYGMQLPSMLRQEPFGVPSAILSLGVITYFIVLLLRASAKGALMISLMAITGLVVGVTRFFMAEPLFGVHPSPLATELSAAGSLVATFCAFDLWSKWRKPALG